MPNKILKVLNRYLTWYLSYMKFLPVGAQVNKMSSTVASLTSYFTFNYIRVYPEKLVKCGRIIYAS